MRCCKILKPPVHQEVHSKVGLQVECLYSLRGASQQQSTEAMPHSQPQQIKAPPHSINLYHQLEAEAQRPEAMTNSNMQKAGQTMPGATARLHPERTQPQSSGIPDSEGKTDEEEPRKSTMHEGRRPVDPQRQLTNIQEQQNRNDVQKEDHDADSYPQQNGHHSTTKRKADPGVVSGHQSILNMSKARADATVEASGDCPSFTDRESHPALVIFFLDGTNG